MLYTWKVVQEVWWYGLASGGSHECSAGFCFNGGLGAFPGYKTKRVSSRENLTVAQTELVECGYCRQYTVISSSKLRYTNPHFASNGTLRREVGVV